MVRFQVNLTLPLACFACSRRERGQRLSGGGAQPVTGRRGGYAAAAGRTVLAASTASFDCLLLCSAFQGVQLQAQRQTPSCSPSPACHYCPGRWKRLPGAAPERRWEEPREGEVLCLGRRARTQPHRTQGRLSTQPGCSWDLQIRSSPTSQTSSVPGLLRHAHHSYQNRRALRAAICICPVLLLP